MYNVSLLTLSDFAKFPEVNKNTNFETKVEPFIIQAQVNDLKCILGNELYYDLLKDFSASPSLGKYTDLFNGVEYTYSGKKYTHEGIKNALIYFSLSRITLNRNVNDTPFGTVSKTTPYSEKVDESVVNRQVSILKSTAINYLNDVVDYLNRNSNDYPLWRCKENKKSTIKISSIG